MGADILCFANVLNPLPLSNNQVFTSLRTTHRKTLCSRRAIVKNLLYHGSPKAEPLSPVLILPGLGNSYVDYVELAQRLAERGHLAVAVAPVQRWQWGLNAKGFFTADYWRGTLRPDQVLDWYFASADKAISEIAAALPHALPLNVLGHSAGGWLGRAFIADRAVTHGIPFGALVTLGTPNRSPPDGKLDQTRGLLSYVEENCDVSGLVSDFVCVAGTGTVGKPLGKGSASEYVAFLSYAAVCGAGNVDGDGVTPLDAACATNGKLVVCEDTDHSMLTSKNWYGNGNAFNKWVDYLS